MYVHFFEAVTACWRGSDLSNLPKYCIAEYILKLKAHKWASVSQNHGVSSKSQFRESHRGEACQDMKKKTVAQELKMKFYVVVDGSPKVLPAQKPVGIKSEINF